MTHTADNTDRQETAAMPMPIKPLTPESYTYARTVGRCNRLSNARHYGSGWDKGGQVCNDGEDHKWQPVSFVFETQLLDGEGRVRIRQPDISEGRVYVVCMGCRSHTYVVTEWVGYFLGGPGDGTAGPDPVLGSASEGFVEADGEDEAAEGETAQVHDPVPPGALADQASFVDDVTDFVEQHGYMLTDWQKRYLRAQFQEQEIEIRRRNAADAADGSGK